MSSDPKPAQVAVEDGVEHPLEPSGAEMRRLVLLALERIVRHVERPTQTDFQPPVNPRM